MEKNSNRNLKKNFGISEETNSVIEKALRKATREALKKHKLDRNTVAVWEKGKIILLTPEKNSLR